VLAGRRHQGAAANAGPYAKEVSEAVPKIEKAVGLTFKTPPRVERRSKDEVRNFLMQKFNESMPPRRFGHRAHVPPLRTDSDTLQLRPFMLELLTEQVVGYYDPSAKVLYVVDGADPALVGVTVTHELVHALQDQYLNLDSIQKITGDNDRQVAAQAVIEGQATFEQVKAMLGSNSLPRRFRWMGSHPRHDPRGAELDAGVLSAPMIIQETLIFPYLSGAEFIRHFDETHPGRSRSTRCRYPQNRYFTSPRTSRRGTRRVRSRFRSSAAGHTPSTRTTWASSRRVSFCSSTSGDQNGAIRGAPVGTATGTSCSTPRARRNRVVTVWDSKIDAGEFYDLVDTSILKAFPERQAEVGG
jgi:hypothetical protein